MSLAKIIVATFIIELSKKAAYGLKGEKPLALIAALKYLHDNKISGVNLIDLIEDLNYSEGVKSVFISLAQKTRITDPSSSWSVITGSEKELQNAIKNFREENVNKAFSELKPDEIESLLTSYMKRL